MFDKLKIKFGWLVCRTNKETLDFEYYDLHTCCWLPIQKVHKRYILKSVCSFKKANKYSIILHNRESPVLAEKASNYI